ncbi:MAG: hypothetical protein IJI98_06785 [Methanosphaera sp.]|uniref:hypothetical protein n=1 Tax=Methanosphaera sp. ISO3-F5 TaxID=1452353 RepID=UPI002B259316|nr:hypothetical protein [Methanosphaera sp. ISO3-F5]MBR0472389.1 hypothetical protein [Methanosphaera sp.]WQH65377.1 hypothetical protein PXD04_11560 [Methanosphaera sp. ISO3-F5]
MELKQIVLNKRSGVIHTRDCESVKQMKGSNKHIELVKDVNQIENKKPCGHCLRKRDLKKIYKKEYKRRKKVLEERRKRDHKRVDQKYDAKQEKLREDYEESIIGLDDE